MMQAAGVEEGLITHVGIWIAELPYALLCGDGSLTISMLNAPATVTNFNPHQSHAE